MKRILFAFAVIVGFFGILTVANAQTPRPSALSGDVESVSTDGLVLKTKDGKINVILTAKTEYKRVPPENPTLQAAVPSTVSEIEVGDKLLVTGILSEDKTTIPARSVFLMSKSDIARKLQKESEEWSTRGISGRVASINMQTSQISVEVRGLSGTSTVVITPREDAKFLRYAPNSVKYSEATESSLTGLSAGDMIRALGDKSGDGLSFSAEEIISGAFQTTAGTVKSVDIEKGEVVISDLQSKKELTIVLAKASVMKKFPAELAMRMSQPGGGGAGPQGFGQRTLGQPPTQPPTQPQPQQGPPSQGGGQGRGGFGGQRGAGIDDMLDRFPDIKAADLKVGDMIAVSSTRSTESRINAIKLLAGVEPFVRAAQASGQGGRGGRGGRGGQGADGGFSIPGLEGFDFP